MENKKPKHLYHYKCTVCVDLSTSGDNVALQADAPAAVRNNQRVMHIYNALETDAPMSTPDYYTYCIEKLIVPNARQAVTEVYGIPADAVANAVVIVDSINYLGAS